MVFVKEQVSTYLKKPSHPFKLSLVVPLPASVKPSAVRRLLPSNHLKVNSTEWLKTKPISTIVCMTVSLSISQVRYSRKKKLCLTVVKERPLSLVSVSPPKPLSQNLDIVVLKKADTK